MKPGPQEPYRDRHHVSWWHGSAVQENSLLLLLLLLFWLLLLLLLFPPFSEVFATLEDFKGAVAIEALFACMAELVGGGVGAFVIVTRSNGFVVSTT